MTEAATAHIAAGSAGQRVDFALQQACEEFLNREAEYLDDRRFAEWFELLDPAIDYSAPVRTGRENWDGTGISDTAFYLKEDHASIEMRVKRLRSRYAWSESPATRTRRMVSNIRVTPHGSDPARVAARSNLVVFCHRGDAAHPQILTAERFDEIRICGNATRLIRRTAILDATVLGLESLSIFL
ncbi:MAG: aromatic-ring-hydroxylating dioxygenase subunit beta [Sphingomonas sp.]|uniref:aromatic-ring-hydroxylating dioxygenase subunit beta n=1 Tax=Sphingomonas sp. TaxID=28214 RepID=UPI00261E92E1|nr:aromatic-ring-hydroxylating dioxygenase subunit beta [Sphingomonas sp.]MDK2766610.1 aromatic-ring-hydroxylating dioxygenase subunit beta [Sphingomonas sp.]